MITRAPSFFARVSCRYLLLIALIVLAIHAGTVTGVRADDAATVEVDANGIVVTPATSAVTYLLLRVADPRGDLISEESTAGTGITWAPPAGAADGFYTWEVRAGFSARKTSRDEAVQAQEQTRPWSRSETFLVKEGTIVSPSGTESGLLDRLFSTASAALGVFMDLMVPPAWADQVFQDDVIVQGSLGVGMDNDNGEPFGYDTIRLKENNLRIRFYDTSNSASFPTNDWQIVINDFSNGGANYFAVEDLDAGRRPFTIEAGARSNSLYVDNAYYSRIGIGTSTPGITGGVHTVCGNTPTVRLEQDGSSGWAPQTWDVAGHETYFFIRDVTHGSNLPFRIFPGTPSDTLCVGSGNGAEMRVGIGTRKPAATLDVQGDARIGIESGTTANVVEVYGTVRVTAGTSFPAKLEVNGNAFVLGNLEMGSSREYKENIRTLEVEEAMKALQELRPVKFHYTVDPDEESVGFIAEEVPDLVATNSRKSLSTMDIVAVIARVTQEQQGVAREQQKVIEQLTLKIADLESKLKTLSRNTHSGGAL